MNAPIVLITAFCLFLSYFPQSAHSSAKTVCFGKGNESFTVEAWHNGQMKYNYDTHLDNATGQQCAVVNTQNWVGLSDYEVITFSRYPNNEVVGTATVQLLCEIAEHAEVIDFSQGVRHYYRDANGALFFSDANDVVYFVGANDDLYSVHGNGDWQLLPKP
ncbi:hypothetical protein niasHT_013885 [Heterodera trifolii]|uniref:Uncharacterized protein n=1 Tax=Heterodera trifolii TaxID=157864 RepID=A0ABD2KUE5_9BILA